MAVYHSSLRGMQESLPESPDRVFGNYADDEDVEGKGLRKLIESSDLDTDNATNSLTLSE